MLSESETFRVFVRRNNNAPSDKRAFVEVSTRMSFKKFLKAGGKKLGIKATRCFAPTAGGGFNEITFIDELRKDDEVILSEGEGFHGDHSGPGSAGQEVFVSVLGAGGVGKSALTLRFVRDFFVQDWDPTIEDAYRKTVNVDSKLCTLSVLDTAGQEDFESLRHQWMMDKDGYVFVYSVDKKQSLDELDPFFNLYKHINGTDFRVPIILVANKKDITDLDPNKREVTIAEGRKKAAEYGAIHVETSAATGERVADVFERLILEVRKRKAPSKPAGLGSKCAIL
ncbi:Ras-like protein [Hondaea fermentalgiana]|uniref:Ras-like protein n=1 Tax=Hondaea fermentalgiana TaxID=2315210 RepID=A0A2R5G2X8_9STRA|nr:Ras-like protein [Hondaea fermentalgiana]|eukprot:GBG24885.1 Ras-like protein [Hondaea fermentalgiana]